MASTCWVRNSLCGTWHALTERSHLGRPGQGLHQEDHVAAEQMDATRQDLQARRRHHRQGDGRARGAVAVRRAPPLFSTWPPPLTVQVQLFNKPSKKASTSKATDKENAAPE